MAKNKKPRKAYYPKAVRTLCVARGDISGLQDMINRTALAAEISLPRGVATVEQLSCMKTLINHALTGIVSRNYLDGGFCFDSTDPRFYRSLFPGMVIDRFRPWDEEGEE